MCIRDSLHLVVLGGQPVEDRTGLVGGAVVDHQHLGRARRELAHRGDHVAVRVVAVAPPRPRAGRLGVAAMVAGGGLLAALAGGPVLVLCTLLVAAALAIAAHDLRAGHLGVGLAWGLVAAGAGLAAVPELVVVVNDIGRQNTVFKFGYSAWVLASLGAAALGVALVDAARPDAAGALARARTGGRWVRRATVGGLAAVALPALVFWPSATPARLDARFAPLPPTLDGRAWLRQGPLVVEANGVPPLDVTADNALIDWLRTHGRAGETLVEATGPSYSWVARVSVATGLPTVIGWNYHEEQQRRTYAATVGTRRAAVDDLYRTADRERILRVLATYRPDYVVIGSVERARWQTNSSDQGGSRSHSWPRSPWWPCSSAPSPVARPPGSRPSPRPPSIRA